MPIIAIPEALRDKLGPEATHALVDLFNEAGRQTRDEVVTLAAEKFERRLAQEIAGLETRITRSMAELETRLTGNMASLRGDVATLETRFSRAMAQLETRVIARTEQLETRVSHRFAAQTRWMFVFWTGQVTVLLGILFAFFRP